MTKLQTNMLMLALTVITVLSPELASASTFDLGGKMCNVYNCIVSSSLLLVLATVAIFFLGIGAFFGKVNWGLVFIIGIGVMVIVGAGKIAAMFTGGGSCIGASCS